MEIHSKLTIIGQPFKRENKKYYVLCKCACGNEKVIPKRNVINGITQSCGCICKEGMSQRTKKHGMSTHPIYKIWMLLKTRCLGTACEAHHKNYVLKGIRVCEEWNNDFNSFYSWAKDKYVPGLQIDRINNSGNYEPANCRFVTPAENNHNRPYYIRQELRERIRAEYNPPINSTSILALKYGISQGSVCNIIHRRGEAQ